MYEELIDIQNAQDHSFDPTEEELEQMGVEWMSAEAVKNLREENYLSEMGYI